MQPGRYMRPVAASYPGASRIEALRDDLLGDFPFVDDASRAAALGLLITPFVRPMIAGCTPLFLIDAPRAGNGKNKLASVAAILATGREAAVMPAPQREEEWAKTILSVLIAGSPVLVLDEVSELVG